MSIHVALNHVTHYRYDRPAALGPQIVRLRPAPHCRTQVLSYSQTVEPAQHFINWQQDPFANYQARLVFPERTRTFKVTVDLVVEMAVHNPFDFFLEPDAEYFPFAYAEELAAELAPYRVCEPLTPRLEAFLETIDRSRCRTVDFLVGLNQRIQREISYIIRLEPGVQTPEETLEKALGSCRDSGWLLVQVLRHLGLAARFVSGYLIQLKPDVKAVDGPSGPENDFTDLHAWCEVYLPGAGWIGFDPTSGLVAGEGHIPLACTPQPSSAAPISGALELCEVEFDHQMQVTRIYESPRVTQPYSDAQWSAIQSLGQAVDAHLQAGDVRLTMGGEPTFVATRDRDAAEWNTDALGPTKRNYATALLDHLRRRYGPGGFLHLGQGKWYPGEQLPRWALTLAWRADGEPVWHNPARLADERNEAHYTAEDARRFARTLAATLGVADDHLQAGYEDTWYYLWRERRLPVNVDPFDAKLDDELERARLRRVFRQGLDKVVGYVLPLAPEADSSLPGITRWRTGPWFVRDERLYLIPGDSPMGYRLPLDSLPWVSQGDYPYHIELDPFAPRPALPTAAELRLQGRDGGGGAGSFARSGLAADSAAETAGLSRASFKTSGSAAGTGARSGSNTSVASHAPARGESAHWLTRTALCIEARDPQRANGPKAEMAHGGQRSHLYVFMPPLARLEDYLNLVAAIEATAETLDMAVVLEGYPPPRDPRLKVLQVTPDPGVIEVNIHPSNNWDELVERTEFLYEAAHQEHLGAEKFMMDGRHTGTGGGNHFVLGGATPEDSPFLRRPELLASLMRYWLQHPSLSYLFSGLFIGPTSQAPRIDEARHDQVLELEIALAELERQRGLRGPGQALPPWLLDRSLRNILIDVTGNTHRSEFCIDKMYSPDSSTGRLGLLELRAFEMPPHARMSIVQQLLLRALVARFWEQPLPGGPLPRWGTALHDRFMLPTFVWMDFEDVIEDLRRHGYPFELAWFAPHFEFRFPLIGQVAARGIELTLRMGLEPWHVMGEEGSAGGTVRFVDSSLERLEVHVSGWTDTRHVITVNGRTLPLQATGTTGEWAAGVRYRAWQPASALHPTIGVHAPLTFDVVDTWMQRSVGGCQYHVTHPGGRNYTTFPVNAYEAESRRLARFFKMGHTPGSLTAQPVAPSREHPFTLDLRRS